MSDEYPTLPGFESMLQQRIAQKSGINSPLPPAGTVDPYKLMMQRKSGEMAPIDTSVTQQWPEEDVKALTDFCQKNGIVGMSTRQNPKLALMQLKRQIGDYSEVPLEERVPEGYERLGTPNKYNANYPYSQAVVKKQIIHG